MRSFDDEMELRGQQRQRYFEDPFYRKWSDMQDSTLDLYRGITDNNFFIDYLFGDYGCVSDSPKDIRSQMDKGDELPINWNSLYAYFDERLNDPENDYKHQLMGKMYGTYGCDDEVSLMEILEEYRDFLLQPMYDII